MQTDATIYELIWEKSVNGMGSKTDNHATRYGGKFDSYGDWIIWRSTGLFEDFDFPICTKIIQKEIVENGTYHLTDNDIERILARYKEHVNYWNVGIMTIQNELGVFANATQRAYSEIAGTFNSLQPKRFPPKNKDNEKTVI